MLNTHERTQTLTHTHTLVHINTCKYSWMIHDERELLLGSPSVSPQMATPSSSIIATCMHTHIHSLQSALTVHWFILYWESLNGLARGKERQPQIRDFGQWEEAWVPQGNSIKHKHHQIRVFLPSLDPGHVTSTGLKEPLSGVLLFWLTAVTSPQLSPHHGGVLWARK